MKHKSVALPRIFQSLEDSARIFPIIGTLLLLALAAPGTAHADDLLVGWDFAGNNGDETAVTATVVSSLFVPMTIHRAPLGPPAATEPDGFWSTNWPSYTFADTNYLEFSITPKPGCWYSPTSIFVQAWLKYRGTGEYQSWRLRSDQDGFAADLDFWDFYNYSPPDSNITHSVSLPASFSVLRTTLVFRLYANIASGGPDAGLKGPGVDLAVYGPSGIGAPSYEGPLLAWDFAGKAGDETTVNATTASYGLVTSAISRSASITAAALTNTFNGQGWPESGSGFDASSYFQFPIQPVPGFEYTITAATYRVRFDGSSFVTWNLRSDRDSYVGNLDSWFVGSTPAATGTPRAVSITSGTFSNLAYTTTFRLYGYDICLGPDAGLGGTGDDLALWGRLWFDNDGDVNSNGIPNGWEMINTGSATGAVVGSDSDGDTFTDDEEWFADTNPRDSNDYLSVTDIEIQSPPSVFFNSHTSRVYSLLHMDNLLTGGWDYVVGVASNVPGNGGVQWFTDTNNVLTQRNYRVEATLP